MTDIHAIAVPDTSHYVGVKVNGIVYVKLEDARKLREGWDAADKRIAELEAAMNFYANREHYTPPNYNRGWGLVAEDCGKRARAALEGKGNE